MSTTFTYNTVSYVLETCPENPFSQSFIENTIASSFQEGTKVTRPRISKNISTYKLNFTAASEQDKVVVQALEATIRGTDTFTWTPAFPLDYTDYTQIDDSPYDPADPSNLKAAIQERSLRLVTPIQYETIGYLLWNFTLNVEEV